MSRRWPPVSPLGVERLGAERLGAERLGARTQLPAHFAAHRVRLGRSFGLQKTPLGGGCDQLLGGTIATQFFFTNAVGQARSSVALPALPGLRGVMIHGQGAVLDPASPIGVAVTGAITLVVGD